MSDVDSKRRAGLDKIRRRWADEDLMLNAYGRYWLPHVDRIAAALEKIEARLAERAEEHHIMEDAKLEIFRGIAHSLMQLIVGELKERWLISHQNHTEAELKAAMSYYDSMAVSGSGLKHDDK
jgi:hypothetical protein